MRNINGQLWSRFDDKIHSQLDLPLRMLTEVQLNAQLRHYIRSQLFLYIESKFSRPLTNNLIRTI